MAKTTGPLMSLDASGSFGGALTFGKWKGRNVVRQLVVPSNPRSTGQMTQREAFSVGGRFNKHVEFGSPLHAAMNEYAPSGQSGASTLVKEMHARYATQKTAYNTGGNSTVKGYFDAAAAEEGILDITIPGDTPVVIPAGLILWVAYSAVNAIDDSIATTLATAATEASINTFQTALNAA